MSADLHTLLSRYHELWRETLIDKTPVEAMCWLDSQEHEAFRAFRSALPWWKRLFCRRDLPYGIRTMNIANIRDATVRRFLSDTAFQTYDAVLRTPIPAVVLETWAADSVVGPVIGRALQTRWSDIKDEEPGEHPLCFQGGEPCRMRRYITAVFDDGIASDQSHALGGEIPARPGAVSMEDAETIRRFGAPDARALPPTRKTSGS
ncbi:MAG: hypothetical protein F8N15_01265 [Methanobacterium sp.]|nr:hypothetical protein [Methanobacterium sp.]